MFWVADLPPQGSDILAGIGHNTLGRVTTGILVVLWLQSRVFFAYVHDMGAHRSTRGFGGVPLVLYAFQQEFAAEPIEQDEQDRQPFDCRM